MLTLIETLTGFAAIMLMLSLLVKTLTSVLKNYFDYYSDNLEHEVKRLVLETTGKTWDQILNDPHTPPQVKSFAESIAWERLGAEFLSAGYLSWFLRQLDQNARVSDLESRLKIHVAKVNYAFEMRMKNLALAMGLGMCLLCNINAFTIWKTLYTDQQLRGTFATNYADKATALAEAQAKGTAQATPANPQNQPNPANAQGGSASQNKAQLDAQMKDFQQSMRGFLTDVSFGVGRIWREDCLRLNVSATQQCKQQMREETAKSKENLRQQQYQQKIAGAEKIEDAGEKEQAKKDAKDELNADTKADTLAASLRLAQESKETQSGSGIFIYEFFGSLLTGILVSIGAPYWHDILQALSSLRAKPAAPVKSKA